MAGLFDFFGEQEFAFDYSPEYLCCVTGSGTSVYDISRVVYIYLEYICRLFELIS